METLYLVIPCYNEEQMLPITAEALMKKMDRLISDGKIASNSKVMFAEAVPQQRASKCAAGRAYDR